MNHHYLHVQIRFGRKRFGPGFALQLPHVFGNQKEHLLHNVQFGSESRKPKPSQNAGEDDEVREFETSTS